MEESGHLIFLIGLKGGLFKAPNSHHLTIEINFVVFAETLVGRILGELHELVDGDRLVFAVSWIYRWFFSFVAHNKIGFVTIYSQLGRCKKVTS